MPEKFGNFIPDTAKTKCKWKSDTYDIKTALNNGRPEAASAASILPPFLVQSVLRLILATVLPRNRQSL